jgi:hypothetical protein
MRTQNDQKSKGSLQIISSVQIIIEAQMKFRCVEGSSSLRTRWNCTSQQPRGSLSGSENPFSISSPQILPEIINPTLKGAQGLVIFYLQIRPRIGRHDYWMAKVLHIKIGKRCCNATFKKATAFSSQATYNRRLCPNLRII